MLSLLRKVADGLIGLSAMIGAIGLFFEVVIILADVVMRFFGAPIIGAQDLSQMAMTFVVFGGMALCDKIGGHVAVDILERSFPRWLNRLSNIVSVFLGSAIFACLAWTIYESAKLSIMLNLATNIISLPKHYFQWGVSILSVITAFAMFLRGIELILAYSPYSRKTSTEEAGS
jgi:TRAP-type C4-dicarboxylate transport system permease small subunit